VDVDWSRPCISHSADPDDVTTTLERVNLGALVIAERATLVKFVVSGGVRSRVGSTGIPAPHDEQGTGQVSRPYWSRGPGDVKRTVRTPQADDQTRGHLVPPTCASSRSRPMGFQNAAQQRMPGSGTPQDP
jgi:hypothetical protein